MLTLKVGKTGDYLTITEALEAVPYETKATLFIEAGVYNEKVFCDKKNITLIGAGTSETIIKWNDYANKMHPDKKKYGTFRSFTAFFSGRVTTVKDLTIHNDSPHNNIAGQAIAAYVDSKIAHFTNVNFVSFQDTLFCAPLPDAEREIGGFFGPRAFTLRESSFQFYHNCKIYGNVDFIFGGADALFHECVIVSTASGYICAPSGKAEGAGFIFTKCQFLCDDCEENSTYLARPWREEGKMTLLNCYLDRHINEAGFSAWRENDSFEVNACTTFIEHESYGPGAKPMLKRVPWVKMLDDAEVLLLNERINHASQLWGVDEE